MEELISIVIPVYNVEHYLDRALTSVLNQTFKNLEIIVVDDGSTDSSYNICRKYAEKDSRIVLIHQENRGVCGARNKGIENAHGDYITFLDSDDYLSPNYIAYLYQQIKNLNVDISSCEAYVIRNGRNKRKIETNPPYRIEIKEAIDRLLYDDLVHINVWAKMFKTSLFDEIRFPVGMAFEESAVIHHLLLKANAYSIGTSQEYYYFIRDNSITTSNFSKSKLDLVKNTNKMCDDILEVYPEFWKGAVRRKAWASLSTLNQLYRCVEVDVKIEEGLLNEIMRNKKTVLRDRRVCLKDKVGVLSASLGQKTYNNIWKVYSLFRTK